MTQVRLPKVIYPCPIIEAIIEFRFDPIIEADAVFGLVYNQFKEKYPKLIKLPILQLPEVVRQQPDLRYKPSYKMMNDEFIFQIGSHVISLTSFRKYVGWEKLFQEIKECIAKLNELQFIGKYSRVGLRYINFFDINIFDKIKFELNQKNLKGHSTSLRTEMISDGFLSILQVANSAEISVDGGQKKKGSLIDIDVIVSDRQESFENMTALIEQAHTKEKEIFFELIGEYITEFKVVN